MQAIVTVRTWLDIDLPSRKHSVADDANPFVIERKPATLVIARAQQVESLVQGQPPASHEPMKPERGLRDNQAVIVALPNE